MRVPPTLPPDLQQALRDIWQRLDRQSGPNSVDLHGRRFLNAGEAIEGHEYITREEVERLLAGETAGTIFGGGSAGGTAETTPTPIPLPTAPSSPVPATGGTGVSLSPTLVWTGADATGFHVYFGTGATPPLVSTNQPSEAYTPAGPLTENTTYSWKVVSVNAIGSTTGPLWTFTTLVSATAPDTPASPSPADNATSVGVLPRLTWTSARATNYTVSFGNSLFNYTCATEQPNGTSTSPVFARDLWFGYYYSYSKRYGYGGNAPENFVYIEDLESFELAVAQRLKMVVNFDYTETDNPVTYADTTGHESLIIGISVGGGTAGAVATAAATVAGARPVALAAVPIIGDCDGFFPTTAIANVDWLGLHCYVLASETTAQNTARVTAAMATIAAGTPAQKFVLVGQSYTSNTNNTQDAAQLLAAQSAPAAIAFANTNVVMIAMFAWERPSGVIYTAGDTLYAGDPDHEADWRPIHEAIFDSIQYRDYGLANYTCPDERDLLTPADRMGPAWSTCPDERDDGWLVDVGAADPPAIAATGLSAASWSPPRLAPAQTYLWKIRASNVVGTTEGPEWDFATGTTISTAPGIPNTPSPARGTVGIPLSIVLTWAATGATSYTLYFGATSAPVLYRSGLTMAQCAPPTLSAGVTYYWYVTAINAAGNTTGSVWYFTTAGAAGPDTPTTPSPADAAIDIPLDVTFGWAPSARADWYTVGYGTVFPPTPALYPNDENPTKYYTPSFTPPTNLIPSTRYYWYVQAWNAAGKATGPVWSFVTKAAATPPPAPMPTEPTGHTIDIEGYNFRIATTRALWRWQGASYFGMLSDYLGSGIAAGVYDWARSVGVNTFRVLTMKCGDPRRRGNGFPWAPLLPSDYSDGQLGAFLSAVEAEGFYVQLVCLADCLPETDTGTDPTWAGLPTLAAKQAHVTRIADVAASHPRTFVELANEPYINGVTETDLLTLSCASGVWICKGSGEAPYPYKPAWHYGTEHSPRTTSLEPSGTASWPRRAKNLREYEREGGEGTSGDTFPPFNIPFVGNEPMGMDEEAIYPLNGTQRSWTAQDHADYHAVAAVFASGSTIHLQCLGLEGTLPLPGSDQERCVEAVRLVWEDMPVAAKAGSYTAGHLSTCPLLQDVNTVAKIYGTISGNEAWVVTVGRNMATYVEQVRAGWRVVGHYGYNDNIVKLEKL